MSKEVYKSPLPPVNLVSSHLYQFLFTDQYGSLATKVPQDKACFIDAVTGRTLSFGQVRSLVPRLAYTIRHKLGLQPGDTILLVSPNTLLTPIIAHASLCANLIYTCANPAYQAEEIAHQLQDSGAKAIITHKDIREKVIKAGALSGIPESKIYSIQDEPGTPNSIWNYFDPSSNNTLIPSQFSSDAQAKSATALMCYSSGTSGKPKGVESSHFNLSSITLQIANSRKQTSDDIYICLLPMFHIYAAFYFLFRCLYLGNTVVVLPHFEMDLFLRSITKYRVTVVNAVPPIIIGLNKMNDFSKYDLSSVTSYRCGAAPLGADSVNYFENKFGIGLEGGYGMTETTCSVTCGGSQGRNGVKDSLGPLLPNMEGKIVDGEIYLRGPNIMKGYYNNEKANKETFTEDGWMRTGDVGHFDEAGNLFITDRLKELIKYKGFQVAPAELEDLLLKHPEIADVAVIGVQNSDKTNELPRAYVVLKETSKGKVTPDDIVEWAAKQTAPYKRLRGGVILTDSVPKNPSGKILRRVLRDQVAKENTVMKAKL